MGIGLDDLRKSLLTFTVLSFWILKNIFGRWEGVGTSIMKEIFISCSISTFHALKLQKYHELWYPERFPFTFCSLLSWSTNVHDAALLSINRNTASVTGKTSPNTLSTLLPLFPFISYSLLILTFSDYMLTFHSSFFFLDYILTWSSSCLLRNLL